ncbi:PHP domain-containing protein [Desulfotomaculum copahuensis]|uniref:Phosphatase n=1 Tax=Desulfotomaculum copahuensis TaxID=1838280 RepID=A0A1B7LJP4_9FIRM|nr:PHP domain-containing protein [Desulfotomaculum copahuensis]OAT86701.1 phosphatase [Desulfotomaculum copahuensis]
MAADLHVHTTASDGTGTPAQVVAMAKGLGLDALAITDHDTVAGVVPALAAGRELGQVVLPGVELGTRYGGREIHMLGYLIDVNDGPLLSTLEMFRHDREQRLEKMLARLAGLGFPLTREQVAAEVRGGAVGRPHVARALVKTGAVSSLEEAFDLYLGDGRPAYVPRLKYTPEAAIGLIRHAGGVAVLAHPGLSRCDELIPGLVRAGLQGLEVYHPEHDAAATERYRMLCRRCRLVGTGGSDFHGLDHRKHGRLAAATAPGEVVRELKELAGGKSRRTS